MRFFRILNRVCYAICILSIVVGAGVAYIGIWSTIDEGLMWRGLGSALVAFSACVLTLAVNSMVGAQRVLDRTPPACGED